MEKGPRGRAGRVTLGMGRSGPHLSLGADSRIARPQPDQGGGQSPGLEMGLCPGLLSELFIQREKKAWLSRPGALRLDKFTGCCQMCSLLRGHVIELPIFILLNIDPEKVL